MITADTDYAIETSGTVQYRYGSTKIWCLPSVDKDGVTVVDIQVWDTAGEVFWGSNTQRFVETTLEAYTSGESGEVSQFKNIVDQAVVDYLEGISVNAGVTFTIV